MIVQFSGPESSTADTFQNLSTALFSGPAGYIILGVLAYMIFSKGKHAVKAKRISRARSSLKRRQSRLRSLERKFTRRGTSKGIF